MKTMIDCDDLMERKCLRKVVYKKEGVKRANVRRKEKQGECGHIPHQVHPLNCHSQQLHQKKEGGDGAGDMREREILGTLFYLRGLV